MNGSLRQAVRQRALGCCEYCLLPEDASPARFQVEHVIARQHAGQTVLHNLAFSCHHCNLHKGPNISGIDPRTGKLVRLFHPRRMKWERHFRLGGPILLGRTPVGRATIAVLKMNHEDRIELREGLIREGLFPRQP
jgi:hypothetical protein